MTSGRASLRQEVDPAQLRRLLLEDADELVTDAPPLLLRVLDAGEACEEPLARVHHHEVMPRSRSNVTRSSSDSRLRIRPWST
jgi:hypothetical protein